MRRGSIAWILVGICLVIAMRGGTDIEEQAFIVTVGLDIEDNGDIRLSVQIPSAQASSSGSGPSSETASMVSGYELVNSIAPNIVDAIEVLDASVPRDINCSQVLQVVVSEALASHPDFFDTLLGLITFQSFRQSAEIVVCRGKAIDFIQAQQPFLGIRLSANIRTSLEVYGKNGDIPRASIGETIRRIQGGWEDVVMPYTAIIGTGGVQAPVEGRPLDVMAGQLPFDGNEKIEYLGSALFTDGRMVGVLTGMETQFLSFVIGEMEQFTFAVDDVYYLMDPIFGAHLSVDTTGTQWKLRVSGMVQACVLRHGEADAERVKEAFSNEVLNTLQKLQGLGVDPMGFEGKAIRSYGGGLKDWESVNWADKYQDAAIEVQIKVRIGEAY